MQESPSNSTRWNTGFTLAELLVTAGILAVLLAVAIPSVVTVQRNLKMMQLDATAKEIFLTAQNCLTARMAAGTLDALGPGSEDSLLFLQDGESGMELLLPPGAVDPTVAQQHYIVRCHLKYATVLDVFYTEQHFEGAPQAVWAVFNGGVEGADRARRAALIGYYGGSEPPPPRSADPTLAR